MKRSIGEYVVRSWRENDAERLQRYADNRKIWLNLRDVFPHPYTLEDARWWIAHGRREDPQRSFAIATFEEVIGGIGFTLGQDVHRYTAELGYWLAEPYWGRGIMSRVVRSMADFAFAEYSLMRVFALPFADNLASARVLEKAGFAKEGVLRASVVKAGAVLDQVMYARIRDDGTGPRWH